MMDQCMHQIYKYNNGSTIFKTIEKVQVYFIYEKKFKTNKNQQIFEEKKLFC